MENKKKQLESFVDHLISSKDAMHHFIAYHEIEQLSLDHYEYDLLLDILDKKHITVDVKEVVDSIGSCCMNFATSEKDYDDFVSLYLRDASYCSSLSKNEFEKYFILYQHTKNQELKNKLIESHLELVVRIARKFLGKGIDFLDLVQEGNLGLLNAFETFDYRKGVAFSVHARWYIWDAIVRSFDHLDMICVPVYVRKKMEEIFEAERVLEQSFFREPTMEEIADYLRVNKEEVIRVFSFYHEIVSADDCLIKNDEEELDLFETISDSENVSVEDEVVDELFFDKIMEEAKTVLSDLEINLIKDRVGFCRFGYVPSLKELEAKYCVSRSRIRQREIYAYEKIRKQLIAKGVENPYGEKIYTRC